MFILWLLPVVLMNNSCFSFYQNVKTPLEAIFVTLFFNIKVFIYYHFLDTARG